MKTIILTWLVTAAISSALINADGRGFFPVMVQVVDADSGTPIQGAKVRLEGLEAYKELELNPERQTKVLPTTLGKPVTTNATGVAVVFYYGRWSSATSEEKSIYSRSMDGTVIVEYKGKEIYRSTLKAWAEKKKFVADSGAVPWIVVSQPSAK